MHAAEPMPTALQLHNSLMRAMVKREITNAGDFLELSIEIKEPIYCVTKVGFLDDRMDTTESLHFYKKMLPQICYAVTQEDDQWQYFHDNHTSHNGALKPTTKEDRCKFFGDMAPVLFAYNTRIDDGGIYIGFNKMERRLTKQHLSADGIHKALLPRTIEVGSEVTIEGLTYIVKQYIVVDERIDKALSFNEEFTQGNCEYNLQKPESTECKHFLAASAPETSEDAEGIPPCQPLVALTGIHEYHFHITSKEKPLEILIGLDQKPQGMTAGEV